jgi:hypothetical protein
MKFSLRLRLALILLIVLLVTPALSACSRPIFIDEDKESIEAAKVLTNFLLAVGEGNYSKAYGYFDSTYSDITVADLSVMFFQDPTLFTGVEKVEVTGFTAQNDPDSKTKIRGRLSGLIHYGDEVRVFTAEMVKDSEVWYLIMVTFQA